MIRDKTVDKHYQISKEVIDELQEKSKKRFTTEVQAIEYFLRLGFEYDKSKVEKEKMLFSLNQCLSETRFIKKQVAQIFANFGWKELQDPKKCEGYQKFLEQLRKGSNMND